jgi:hypothetical protein
MSPEGELSTEDLARTGGVRDDERPPDEGMERTSAARPRVDADDASVQGSRAQVMPQEAEPGNEQADAGALREGASTAAAQRPGGPEPVPDRLGGGAGDQGSMTHPGGLEGPATAAPSGEAGAAPREGASSAIDGGERPPGGSRSDGPGPGGEVTLLDSADEDRFRQRWADAQARFVDDPQETVRSADGLVAELMQSLAQGFSEHKGRLEAQWQRGGDPDTEELRQALQRYRSFFDRLLST